MTVLGLALSVTVRSTVTVTMVRSDGMVRLVSIERGVAKVRAQGMLHFSRIDLVDLASDGRHLIAVEKRKGVTTVWRYRVREGAIGGATKLKAPRQVGALAMTKDGRCLAGTMLGQVISVFPASGWKEWTGMVARSSAELRLSPLEGSYALRVGYGGMNGILSSCVFAGRYFRDGRVVRVGRSFAENDSPFEDAVYDHSRREILSVDGTSAMGISQMKGSQPRRPDKQIALAGTQAVRVALLSNGLWATATSGGTLTLGRIEKGRWNRVGREGNVPGETQAPILFQEVAGESAMLFSFRGNESIYWAPFGPAGFGTAKRLYLSREFWPVSISY